jgi:hypothetical protein
MEPANMATVSVQITPRRNRRPARRASQPNGEHDLAGWLRAEAQRYRATGWHCAELAAEALEMIATEAEEYTRPGEPITPGEFWDRMPVAGGPLREELRKARILAELRPDRFGGYPAHVESQIAALQGKRRRNR